MTQTHDEDRGVYNKFYVERTDGQSAKGCKHDCCEYFVLDLTHDKHAPDAIRAYANSCRNEYPHLAADLDEKFPRQKHDEATVERVKTAIAGALGDALDCTRVWEAWGYGTMSEDDFTEVRDDGARLEEIARAALSALPPQDVSVQEAAKVLLDALGADGPFEPFMDAADAMLRDRRNGLGPIPMLGSALRALSETDT
mgnify:CR=1 FL=1